MADGSGDRRVGRPGWRPSPRTQVLLIGGIAIGLIVIMAVAVIVIAVWRA